MTFAHVFDVESRPDALVITPKRKIGNLTEAPVQAEWQEILNRISEGKIRHVVFDLKLVPYLGSSMIEAILLVWKRIRSRAGRLVVCNVSETAREVLELSNLPAIWSIYNTREDAIASLQSEA